LTLRIHHLSLAAVGLSKAEWRQRLSLWLRNGTLPEPASEADGASLIEEARRQGLTGLLADAIGRAPWPGQTASRLREQAHLLLACGATQLDAAARAMAVLGQAGLRCLPLKGAAVAEALYPSVACRPMSDVDLLALDDWTASLAALRSAGYQERTRAAHAHGLEDPVAGVLVELHRTPVSCGSLFLTDGEGLWRRRRAVSGRQIGSVPAREDLAILLALHLAFQHSLRVRLVQLLDLRRLVEAAAFDSRLTLDLARQARAERALAMALEAAARWTGASVPVALREELAPRVSRPLLIWLGRLLDEPGEPGEASAAELAVTRLFLVPGRRVALIRETLAPREWAGEGRPLSLALGRFVRLAGAAGRSLTRRRPTDASSI
jgi:hypothetical protein